MNHDRIAEVYDGTHGSVEQQLMARERIHWIGRCVQGLRVLDIGCSQGVLAILLAREGHEVIGIDREALAIAFAADRLANEPEDVRERVEFRLCDAADYKAPRGSFDTVILGEVLEHQLDPNALLDRAHDVVRPGGTIVITTPYGVFPYPDHKQPLYLTELFELILPRSEIVEFELLHRYLAMRLRRRVRRVAPPVPELWRAALTLAERRLRQQDEALERKRRATATLLNAQDEGRRAEERLRDLEPALAQAIDGLVAAQQADKERRSLRRRVQELQARSDEQARHLARVTAERDELLTQLAVPDPA